MNELLDACGVKSRGDRNKIKKSLECMRSVPVETRPVASTDVDWLYTWGQCYLLVWLTATLAVLVTLYDPSRKHLVHHAWLAFASNTDTQLSMYAKEYRHQLLWSMILVVRYTFNAGLLWLSLSALCRVPLAYTYTDAESKSNVFCGVWARTQNQNTEYSSSSTSSCSSSQQSKSAQPDARLVSSVRAQWWYIS